MTTDPFRPLMGRGAPKPAVRELKMSMV